VLADLERAGITVFERGWLSSNNVLARGDAHSGATVVDTGYWIHAEQTVALLRHALDGEPLTRILNTHLHSDHCGGNAAIQRAFGCPIDVPAGEAAAVDAWDMRQLTYDATGQHCPPFARQGALSTPGSAMAGRWWWELIASPGHDPRSLALYQPELQVLISADALWENGFGVVFPEIEGASAFDDVRRTLDTFSRLQVRLVIPGHGAPFTDMHGALGRALHRLESFEKDPRRHALHAAKVLIKFRLLETQSESWDSLMAWLHGARYFGLLRQRHFEGTDEQAWVHALVDDMCRRGVLSKAGTVIRNNGG
jgi:glyoxylase-like metal-dependent hydrolase (beta-lactamase superfamily II)